jgi:anhydro-N-acetylmuramic acid kinase
MIGLGLMSGTSLDGIDAALLDIRPRGGGYVYSLVRSRTVPFDPALRERLLAALPPHEPSPRTVALLDVAVGRALGEAAREVAGNARLDYVASHGLTLYHDGSASISVQIGDPFVLRECVGATVVADFRRADCAAGGQGAPLVPYVDALFLAHAHREIVALNIGGIANLTIIPVGAELEKVRAWDCGPGNMLLDAFVRERTNGREHYDRDGGHASAGRVNSEVLQVMLGDAYFAQASPKSTGRERFGEMFLEKHRRELHALSLEDGCATLSALTVESIARDILAHAAEGARIIVSGGGARNVSLLTRLSERLPGYEVRCSDAFGVDGDMKEAIAFAVLGYEALRGRAAGLPGVTGARYAAMLGVVAPMNFAALMVKIAEEMVASA